MKCVLLCAGYATRLYPLTENMPKALLDVGGKTILNHILGKVKDAGIQQVHLVTNDLFLPQFNAWNKQQHAQVHIISDGTRSNEQRLGALRDLQLVVYTTGADDIMLIAGDNLFDFELRALIKMSDKTKCSVVALHDLGEPLKASKKFGVAVLDKKNKIVSFEEKPVKPKSALAATCCYVLRKERVSRLSEYLENPLGENPGDFIRWLAEREDVYGFPFTDAWFDIGSFESLDAARAHYKVHTVNVRVGA